MKLFDPPQLTGKYLNSVLHSKWLTTGPVCARLREATAAFLGCRPSQVVLASSATAAFQGALDLLAARFWEKNPSKCRDPLIDITFATWPGMCQAYSHAGFSLGISGGCSEVVVLTDIGGRRLIEETEGSTTFYKMVEDEGKVFIHDACHSWAPYPWADFGIVSFYPTKLVPGAEGGAVVCKKEEDADELAEWLYCGLVPGLAGSGDLPVVPGRKANMTDVAAALNLEALELAPAHIEQTSWAWRLLAYQARRIGVPYRDQPVRPYLFQVETEAVETLRSGLAFRGIASAWNFRPAGLVTVPCHRAADPRMVMEAVAEVLGL